MQYNFRQPRKAKDKTSGLVVITSDDGSLTEFTHWFPIFKTESYKQSQFAPFNFAKFSPAVNSAYLGGNMPNTATHLQIGKKCMTYDNLKELQDYGYEISSHGKVHGTLRDWNIAENVNVGATVLKHNRPWFSYVVGYVYTITDNGTSEDFTVSAVSQSGSQGIINLVSPLNNAYTTNAKILITYGSAIDMLQGCIDDLALNGIECKHFVFPFYDLCETTRLWVKEFYESALTVNGSNPVNLVDFDIFDLRRVMDFAVIDTDTIDQVLDYVKLNDSVAFLQGHGNTDTATLDRIRYAISRCNDLGITIGTQTEAVEKIKSRKLNT